MYNIKNKISIRFNPCWDNYQQIVKTTLKNLTFLSLSLFLVHSFYQSLKNSCVVILYKDFYIKQQIQWLIIINSRRKSV